MNLLNTHPETKLNEEKLIDAIFMLRGLDKSFEKERERLTTITTQMTSVTKRFKEDLAEFGGLSDIVQTKVDYEFKQLANTMNTTLNQQIQTAYNLLEETGTKAFTDSITVQTNEMAKKIQELSNNASKQLREAGSATKLFSKRLIASITAATLISGIVSGAMSGGLVYYLTPKLDQHTKDQLISGEMLYKAWPKLTQKERERFMKMARGEGKT